MDDSALQQPITQASPPPSRWRQLWLPLAWLVGAALIWRAAETGPADPGSLAYGVNWPSDAPATLGKLSVEVALLYVMLRPWSYNTSWRRAAIALAIMVPYILLSFAASTHAGPIVGAHLLWLAVVVIGLGMATLLSASATRRGHRAPNEAPVEAGR